MIKIVLWDIDGTLTNFAKAEALGIRNCFKQFKLGRCTNKMLEEYVKINNKYWQALERKEITKPELLVKRFDDFFALYDIKCDSNAFNIAYQEELREGVVLNDGAKQAVEKIEEMNIPQYVVTNGLVESQNKKLNKIGLADKFKKVFISDEIGYDKPSVEFFKPVFEEINKTYPDVNKDEIIIIGDSLTSDIKGGINTGIKTCWYNPNHLDTDLKCDYIIDELEKVPELLKGTNMEETKKTTTKKKTTTTKRTTKTTTKKEVEIKPEVKIEEPVVKVEPEKIVIENKKPTLKDIVDTNYRPIIVCLVAISLLFICLFIGTSGRKNSYALNELMTTESEQSITLPKNWYMTTTGYAIELDGKYAEVVMQAYAMDGVTKDDMVSAIEAAQGTYDIEEGTYSGYDTYILKDIYQTGVESDPKYDCAYILVSDDEVWSITFIDVDSSVEADILNSIK